MVQIHMNKQYPSLGKPWPHLMRITWFLALDLGMVCLWKFSQLRYCGIFVCGLKCANVHYCDIMAASTHDQDVFSFYPDERICNGFEEVLSRYREIVPNIRLAGPRSFAHIVKTATAIVERSGGQYHHVLMILANGQVRYSIIYLYSRKTRLLLTELFLSLNLTVSTTAVLYCNCRKIQVRMLVVELILRSWRR